jgi:hypothetical protein
LGWEKEKDLREEEDPNEESGRDKLALGDQGKRGGWNVGLAWGFKKEDKKRIRENIILLENYDWIEKEKKYRGCLCHPINLYFFFLSFFLSTFHFCF